MGNTECGLVDLFPTPMRPPSYYTLRIASDEVVPGCGKPGSVVTFRVNGRPANETAIWQPGETLPAGLSAAVGRFRPLNTLNLTAGPRFARFWGTVHGAGTSVTAESLIEAWIADTRCGVALAAGNFSTGPGAAVNPYLGVAVLPAELKPGCGREGAAVRFTIDGTQFGGEGAWRPGRRQVDLVVPPEPETPPGRIRAPDTGDAGLKRG